MGLRFAQIQRAALNERKLRRAGWTMEIVFRAKLNRVDFYARKGGAYVGSAESVELKPVDFIADDWKIGNYAPPPEPATVIWESGRIRRLVETGRTRQ